MQVDRTAMTFLYDQVASTLLDEIQRGHYQDGRLPSEQALVNRFEVSRVTVRQALDKLLLDGYIQRRHGKGTFVADRPRLNTTHTLRGFYDALLEQGIQPETRLLEFQPLQPGDSRAVHMDSPDSICFWLRRLYLVDDSPFALVSACLTAEAGRVSWQQASEYPIYGILEQLLGVHIEDSRANIGIQLADVPVAQLLGVRTKQPLLYMTRTSYDADKTVQEHSTIHMKPEQYQFTFSSRGAFRVGTSSKGV